MAKLTFTIPSEKVSQLLQEFTTDYPVTLDKDNKNIMTDTEWVRQDIIEHVKTRCRRGRAKIEMKARELEQKLEPDLIS